jgi:hypothetical protein
VSLLVAPLIIKSFSWPFVFFIFGAVGFVWLAGWAPQRLLKAHDAASARFTASSLLSGPTSSAQGTADTIPCVRIAARKQREEMLESVRPRTCAPFATRCR